MNANRGANGAAPNDGSPPASVTVAPKDGPPAAAPAAGRKS
jgi:hypothetical protein